MTPANKPLLSEVQRERIERYLRPITFGAPPPDDDLRALLADHDRLTSQVEVLAIECACLSHDRLQDVEQHLIERALSEEREACAAFVDAKAEKFERAVIKLLTETRAERAETAGKALREAAGQIRHRGPTLPPLPPYRALEEVERLRATLGRIVGDFDASGRGGLVNITDAVEAARALLGRE